MRSLFSVILLIVAGCTASRTVITEEESVPESPVLPAAAVIDSVRHSVQPIPSTVKITADVAIRSPAFNGAAQAFIAYGAGDTLLVSITATPLSIEVGTLWATPDSFFFWIRLENRLVYGRRAQLEQFVPGLFYDRSIVGLMLGLVVPDVRTPWISALEGEHYRLSNENNTTDYLIDPARWRVVLMEQRAPDRRLVEAVRYSAFEDFEGRPYPTRFTLQRPDENVTVTASYRMLGFDAADVEFSLRIPPTVTRLTVEEALMME